LKENKVNDLDNVSKMKELESIKDKFANNTEQINKLLEVSK